MPPKYPKYPKKPKKTKEDKKKPKKPKKPKKKVPAGSHRMPDGSIMKDSDMTKKKNTGSKATQKKKKNTKMKKHDNDTSSDIKTDTLDLNEPLRYNVKQSIKDDKKIKPQDVFEY